MELLETREIVFIPVLNIDSYILTGEILLETNERIKIAKNRHTN